MSVRDEDLPTTAAVTGRSRTIPRRHRAPVVGGGTGSGTSGLPEPAAPAPVSTGRVRRPGWELNYGLAVVVTDAAMITLSAFAALLGRFGESPASVRGVPYSLLAGLLAPVWVAVLAMSRAYESRFIGVGSEEFKRVFNASVRLFALVAAIAYALRLDLARGFVGLALPVGTGALLAGRYGARKVLHRLRGDGRACHRVVVVGSRESVTELVRQMRSTPYAGLDVVGACLLDGLGPFLVDGVPVPVLGKPADTARCLDRVSADTVAVAGGWAMGDRALRRMAWELEGTGVDFVVAPALTNVAGPRIHIRPVAGLPLLHVEEPEFTGVRRIFKSVLDRTLALMLLAPLCPLLVVTAVAVKASSRGPVFFKQHRVGRGQREFLLWKFRTMSADAEAQQARLEPLNEHDGPLFKIRSDPRVTRVGRLLRRWSIDELPQLINVIRGDMSLVGPRPPLPSEVAGYSHDVRRRLLVKPGVTGLWQVSGRSELSWEETVRLDLHYVENWSVAFDFLILWKTLGAVARGRGAY